MSYFLQQSKQIPISGYRRRQLQPTRTGKYTKTVPTLPDKARKIVLGLVDMVLYCDIETTAGPDGKMTARRVKRTKPSLNYEAGDRTGRLPDVIDLDYTKFIEAFNATADTKKAPKEARMRR
ncbi:MAG: AAA family ATPase [Armatimonadota bacterium]